MIQIPIALCSKISERPVSLTIRLRYLLRSGGGLPPPSYLNSMLSENASNISVLTLRVSGKS